MPMPGRSPGSASLVAELVSGGATTAAALFIPLDRVRVQPGHNPRAAYTLEDAFSETALAELTESVRSHGVIQPILVQQRDNDTHYTLVAGERRYRAAGFAGLKVIPAVLAPNHLDRAELALIENGHHQPVHPVDEALAVYAHLAQALNRSPEEIPALFVSVRKTGRDPHDLQRRLGEIVGTRARSLSSWGQNKAGVLALTEDELRAVRARELSLASALELTRLHHPEPRAALLLAAVHSGMTAPQIRQAVRDLQSPAPATPPDAELRTLSRTVTRGLKSIDALDTATRHRALELLTQLSTILGC